MHECDAPKHSELHVRVLLYWLWELEYAAAMLISVQTYQEIHSRRTRRASSALRKPLLLRVVGKARK
jgi:hypothetical protein